MVNGGGGISFLRKQYKFLFHLQDQTISIIFYSDIIPEPNPTLYRFNPEMVKDPVYRISASKFQIQKLS